jgi:UDP-N-acetyl-D-glucosamine dehydrogenase
MLDTLIKKLDNRTARVGIIGLGYVGLPLAVEFGEEGFQVIGFDISEPKVKLINAGKSDIDDIPNSRVANLVKSGKLKATTDPKLIRQVDTISICVPTPLSKTKDPDVGG